MRGSFFKLKPPQISEFMEFFTFQSVGDFITRTATDDVYNKYLWVSLLIGAVCYLVVYGFKAAGLYTIAKREGYKNRWMAFVPVLSSYYIGVLSEKNKVFGAKPKYVSLVYALAEFVYIVLQALLIAATICLFSGSCDIVARYDEYATTAGTISVFSGNYTFNYVPDNLVWALWIFTYFSDYFITIADLVCVVLQVFVLTSFFRTYSPSKYVLFTVLSVLFPLQGVFIFCVRNNRGINYGQYLKEYQRRRYAAYQEYMRNTQNGNYYGGGYYNPGNANPQNGAPRGNAPEDPFDGMGEQPKNNNPSNDGSSPDDPFDL